MEVNIEKLIELKLSLEGYFILNCLYNDEGNLLERYCKNSVYKIPTRVFEQLQSENYIEIKEGTKDFTLDNMILTDRFKLEVLGLKDLQATTFDIAFQQLREHYPTKTPSGRRLHDDLTRCKRLYKNEIAPSGIIDVEKHQFILQCINFMVKEKSKKQDDLNYLKALPTYLQQKGWELVQEDVENAIKRSGYIEKKPIFDRDESANKTQLGSEDF